MVLYCWRRWKCLQFRHKAEIVLVIIAPPIAFRFLEFLWLNLWAETLVYFGWAVLATLMTAYMVEKDSRENKEGIEQRIEPLTDELERHRNDSTRRIISLEDQIRQVDQVMRAAFEECRVSLPPPQVPLSAHLTFGAASGSAKLQVRHQRWYRRFWLWILCYARGIWKLVWG